MMKFFHFSKSKNRFGLYADINLNGEIIRIFNLHLALAHPKQRQEELEIAMGKYNINEKTIICGDFNIIESPHVNILNWFLGGSMSDVIFYKREREMAPGSGSLFGNAN